MPNLTDRKALHAFLSEKANAGATVTLKEVASHFNASPEAASKTLSLLTGSCVLVEKQSNEFECKRVLSLTVTELDSAASQGKSNTAYAQKLWDTIDRLKKDNETLRAKLLAPKPLP